jgi:hypothetical protein
MNVTPAVLSTAVIREVQKRLEAVGDRPWMEILLTSYCEWTEYSLYLLAAERVGLVERDHVWADHPAAPAHLHVDPAISIWDAAGASPEHLERVFTTEDPGVFAVVQSGAGLPASAVAAAAVHHLPVRGIPSGPLAPVGGNSKLQERVRTASRIAAQAVYCSRRAVRRIAGRWRYRDHPPVSPQPEPPSIR